jgi:hypothetical protein
MITLEVNFADIENCTEGHCDGPLENYDEEENNYDDLVNCFNSVNLNQNFIELDTSAIYVILDITQNIYGEFLLFISNDRNLVLKFKLISEESIVFTQLQRIKFTEYSRIYRDTYRVCAEI